MATEDDVRKASTQFYASLNRMLSDQKQIRGFNTAFYDAFFSAKQYRRGLFD